VLEPRKIYGVVGIISVAVSVLVLGQIVTAGHAAATLDADVDVLDQHCEAGAVDELTLQVDFEAAPSATATAHVWSSRQHVQFSWESRDIRLFDGTQNVTIAAPDQRAYIEGDRAQVWIAVGQQRAIENFEVRRCN